MSYGKAGIRKDSWSHWQDEQLAQVIKEYEQKGKSQQEAFETAGAMIGKTPDACKQRWHTELKGKHWAYEPHKVIPIKQEEIAVSLQAENHEPDYELQVERSGGKWKFTIEAPDQKKNKTLIQKLFDLLKE